MLVNKYLNYDEVLSYGMRHVFIVGDRGVGKTYGLTRWLLRQCVLKNKKFIWVRNSDEVLKQLLAMDAEGFVADHIDHLGLNREDFTSMKGRLLYGEQIIGTFLPLSGFFKIKGSNFDDYDYFVFDEFMPEPGEAIRVDYDYAMKSIMQSIFRRRTNFTAFYLANVLRTSNNMLDFFKFPIEPHFPGQVKQRNKKLKAIIFYLQSDKGAVETNNEGDAYATANKYTESPLIIDYIKNVDPNCAANMKRKEKLFYLATDTKYFLLRDYNDKVAVIPVKSPAASSGLVTYAMHKKFVFGDITFNRDIKKHLEQLWVNNLFVFKSEYTITQFVKGLFMQ